METKDEQVRRLQGMVALHEKLAKTYRQYGVTSKAERAEALAEMVRQQLQVVLAS